MMEIIRDLPSITDVYEGEPNPGIIYSEGPIDLENRFDLFSFKTRLFYKNVKIVSKTFKSEYNGVFYEFSSDYIFFGKNDPWNLWLNEELIFSDLE